MASQGVNILRYSALFGGIGYGFSHQRTIYARDRVAHEHAEEKRQENLLAKARKEWEKKTNPPKGSGIIEDPDDPKFDLEAYLTHKVDDNVDHQT